MARPSGARGVLIVLVFLFPGIWKLMESGWAWIASDNLRNQIHWKWYQHGGTTSWLRIDRYPWLCQLAAGATVVFELTFVAAIWGRCTRRLWTAFAVLFHLATDTIMFVAFSSLWPAYVVMVDARGALRSLGAALFARKLVVAAPQPVVAALRSCDLLGRLIYRRADTAALPWFRLCARHPLALPALTVLRIAQAARRLRQRAAQARSRPPRRHWPGLAAAGVLIGGQLVAGATGTMRGWPFACYPTFQWLAQDEIVHLGVELVQPDGSVRHVPVRPRTQKQWGIEWSVIGVTHGPAQPEALRAYFSTLRPGGRPPHRDGRRDAGAVLSRLQRGGTRPRWRAPRAQGVALRDAPGPQVSAGLS